MLYPFELHHSEIMLLCQPLKKLGIIYFAQVRIINNKFSTISNSPQFAVHYLQNKYYNVDIHSAKSDLFGKYILWDNIDLTGQSRLMVQDAIQFGFQHTFTICHQSESIKDFYHFAANPNTPAINQIYLNNLAFLEAFIQNFNSAVSKDLNLKKSLDIQFGLDELHADYILENQFKNALLENSPCLQPKYIITNAQKKCLESLLKGNTAKEIAKELKISYRTVQNHLEKIRQNNNLKNSKEIILAYSNLMNR